MDSGKHEKESDSGTYINWASELLCLHFLKSMQSKYSIIS